MMIACHACEREIDIKPPLGRRAVCPHCDAELRCCRQCRLHDPFGATGCREQAAEVPRDKAAANFCDFYQPGSGAGGATDDAEARAKAAFDALFK